MNPEESAEQQVCLDALGLLDPSARASLSDSLERSAALDAFRCAMVDVVSQLAWLAPACDPPERLRARVLRATGADDPASL